MENKFVVAHNHIEFKTWYELRAPEIMDHDIRLVFVTFPDILRGHRDISGYLVGNWYKRSDIAEIIENIVVSNFVHPNLYYDYKRKCPYRLIPNTNQRIEYI